MTNRRELLIALGVLVVPLFGRARQTKVPQLGILGITNLEPGLGFLRQALRELGYIEGQSILLEVRSAVGKPSALAGLATELVSLGVDIIVAFQTPAVQAAKQATSAIPIVMAAAGDPVGTGLISSLARPGGNVTGISTITAPLAAKMLETIMQIRSTGRGVAVLANAADPFTNTFVGQIQSAGQSLGVEIRPVMVRGEQQFDAIFAEWAKARVDAVIVQPSLPRERAIALALKHRLLSVSPNRPFVEAGGLFSYAASPRDGARKTAIYVDKILKGAKPADLPVEQPTQFELVVNLKTAKALGITIPQSVLIRADEVVR